MKLLDQIVNIKEARNTQPEKPQDSELVINEVLSILLMTYESKSLKLILQSLVILHKIMSMSNLSKVHIR